MKLSYILSVFILILGLFSCSEKKTESGDDFTISVRIKKEPGFLNPIKSMGTTAVLINQYIFLPLANYHPGSLKLIPLLIEKIPEGIPVDTGTMKGTLRFDCTIRKEAAWDNGDPITGKDYLFTIKTIKHRDIKANASIKSVFRQLKGIRVDSENEKKFSVFIEKDYNLAKELAIITEVLPAYIYDKNNALDYTFIDPNGKLKTKISNPQQDSLLQDFVAFFNHSSCGRNIVSGNGPYTLSDWQTNQKISLIRKENWWGSTIPNVPYFENHAKYIIFKIIPDVNAAIAALKNNTVDIVGNVDGTNFSKLKNNTQYRDRFVFSSPPQLRYYFIGINNHSTFLKDKNIRKALTHLIDIDAFIHNFENGNGVRLNGPILPSRSYYNDTLENIPYDVEKAKYLLEKSGWSDSNSNGIVDKVIDGQTRELKIEVLISGKILGKNLALILKERARPAGIDIDIITKESALIKQAVSKRDFDLYPTGAVLGLYPEDLYQFWHSDNDTPGGSNKYGFSHFDADEIIEKIRETRDSAMLFDLYRQIQAIIYEEQPIIFLYSPTTNIIYNNKFKGRTSLKRPGYFINTFVLKEK